MKTITALTLTLFVRYVFRSKAIDSQKPDSVWEEFKARIKDGQQYFHPADDVIIVMENDLLDKLYNATRTEENFLWIEYAALQYEEREGEILSMLKLFKKVFNSFRLNDADTLAEEKEFLRQNFFFKEEIEIFYQKLQEKKKISVKIPVTG